MVINVVEGRWYGWIETPAIEAGWAASPVFVKRIEPLKSGLGKLALVFLQPCYPGGGRERELTLKVLSRGAAHITVAFDDSSGRTACLAELDPGWMTSYCQELARRRPPSVATFLINGEPLATADVQKEMAAFFGRSEAEILLGSQPGSFECKRPSMPKNFAYLSIGQEFPSFDSWLIARGVTPKAMEEKWFVYMEGGQLLFRRSWTGILVYAVDAQWRGSVLYLGGARANRNPKQYSETDDVYDRQMLLWLIDVGLRRVPSDFPVKESDGNATLKA